MRLYLIAPLLALASCAPMRTTAAPAAAPSMAQPAGDAVVDRLFFGRTIPAGGMVTDSAWSAFMAEMVTPRFPEGLSVARIEGQWLDSHGTLEREQTMVVEVIHPASAQVDDALRQIADEYKRRFQQDAVMRVTSPVRMRFYE